jgi:pSer/pThr/pTyr-binding forkhead associated (FHA) protein
MSDGSSGTPGRTRRDGSPVEQHSGRQTERLPPNGGQGPARRGPPSVGVPVLGPGDFNDADETVNQHDSDPPAAYPAGLLPPAEGSDLHEAPADLPPAPSAPADAFAEFEADIAGESTRIEESDLIADQSTAILDEGPRLPYLFVESGKDKGKEYVLQEGETGVGRGIDNDVILTDVSVSRKHLRVLREGANLVLKDLGSGNGTTVNSRRVHQVALAEGDRIELGETVLVVRTPAASEGHGSAVSAPHETHDTSLPSQSDVLRPQAAPTISAGWPAQPGPISGSMETASPRDGNTATVRLPRRTLLIAGAAVAVLASMIGAGVGVIILSQRSTDPTTPGTTPVVVVSGPGQPPRTIQIPIAPPPPVPTPVSLPSVPTPVPVVAPVPVVVAPVPAPVVAPPPVVEPVAPLPPPPIAVAPPTPTAPTPSPRTPTPTHASSPPPRSGRTPRETASPTSGAQARMLAAYRTGDFDGAAAIARDAASRATGDERRELEQTAGQIDSFASLYPPIHAAGDSVASVARQIPIALNLDRQIAPGGFYAREIAPRYVRWLVSSARSQMSGAPVAACRQVRSALDLDSGNADAQGLARQCETAAQRLLTETRGRETRDAAAARRAYEDIQHMVPRTSSAYTGAQDRLTAMRRARPVDEDE